MFNGMKIAAVGLIEGKPAGLPVTRKRPGGGPTIKYSGQDKRSALVSLLKVVIDTLYNSHTIRQLGIKH